MRWIESFWKDPRAIARIGCDEGFLSGRKERIENLLMREVRAGAVGWPWLGWLEFSKRCRSRGQKAKELYPLPELLLCVVAGALCGAEGWAEAEEYGEAKLDFLRLSAALSAVRSWHREPRHFFRPVQRA
jgi:hypothetical protein